MCTFMNKVYCFHNKRNGHLQLDRDNHRCKCSHPADLKHREDIQSKKIGHSYIMTQFVILSTYLIWNFHAVITDEVANQGTLFHCRGRLWDKTRSHQEFFYTPHVWSWLFRFFLSSCAASTTILTITPYTVREVNTMGFKVMPPATAEVITALPVTTLQIRFFSLVQVALLFLAVMVFVVIGVEIFQHITCPFGQGCVDVVEVKNIFLGVNHWHYNKKTQKI